MLASFDQMMFLITSILFIFILLKEMSIGVYNRRCNIIKEQNMLNLIFSVTCLYFGEQRKQFKFFVTLTLSGQYPMLNSSEQIKYIRRPLRPAADGRLRSGKDQGNPTV